jgi:hypothetical protein
MTTMFRKLMFTGLVATIIGVLAAPANAAGHVRRYTPSKTATVHATQSSSVTKHKVTKLTKSKKSEGKAKHSGKKKK